MCIIIHSRGGDDALRISQSVCIQHNCWCSVAVYVCVLHTYLFTLVLSRFAPHWYMLRLMGTFYFIHINLSTAMGLCAIHIFIGVFFFSSAVYLYVHLFNLYPVCRFFMRWLCSHPNGEIASHLRWLKVYIVRWLVRWSFFFMCVYSRGVWKSWCWKKWNIGWTSRRKNGDGCALYI